MVAELGRRFCFFSGKFHWGTPPGDRGADLRRASFNPPSLAGPSRRDRAVLTLRGPEKADVDVERSTRA